MAYGPIEASVESGQPIELYTFTIGTTVYRYTSAEDEVVYSANTYLPRQIDRTAPAVSSGDGNRPQMEITINADDPIASRYVGIVPAERVEVEILRFHRGDSPNGSIQWVGRVVSAKFEKQGAVARLYSISAESSMSRPCPGRKFQGLCNHTLYDGLCSVVKASFKHTNTVLAVSGDTITVNGISSLGADWAVGGTVEWGNERRLVVAQSGNVLTLRLAFPTSPLGQVVDVYAGCDHTIATCESKFSNAINFGGFPFVPTKNPFNTGLD